ncbi:MAG: DUF262 domain-containing protein [Patescibacteria group bacterium]
MGKKFTVITDCSFYALCRKESRFVIPAFQRPYVWEKEQILALWEDLINSETDCFLGNLVFLDKNDKTFVVVDGQQRLLTLSLVVLALRERLIEMNSGAFVTDKIIREYVENLNETLFFKESQYPFKRTPRIIPGNRKLEKAYTGLIESGVLSGELDEQQKRFLKNYNLILDLIPENSLPHLEEIIKKTTSVFFVALVCASESEAYRIFVSLNSSGLGLSVADLVKNALFASAGGGELEIMWSEMENEFKGAEGLFPDFLRDFWISRHGAIPKEDLFSLIKKHDLEFIKKDEAVNFMEKLLGNAKIYLSLRSSKTDHLLNSIRLKTKDKRESQELTEMVKKFNCLEMDCAYPLALSFLNKFLKAEKYTRRQFISDLNRLWVFLLRAKILNLNPESYKHKLAKQCLAILSYEAEDFDAMTSDFFSKLKKLVLNSEDFIKNFPQELRYGHNNELLKKVMTDIFRSRGEKVDLLRPSLEHILSRRSGGLFKEFVDEIGNLTLLDEEENNLAGNMTVKEKAILVYGKSSLLTNRKLGEKWREFSLSGFEAVRGRSRELAILANLTFSF